MSPFVDKHTPMQRIVKISMLRKVGNSKLNTLSEVVMTLVNLVIPKEKRQK